MHWQDRIGFDSGVLGGKPVVKGTRLAVEKIVELMAAGWTEQQIIENHPGISRDDIAARRQISSFFRFLRPWCMISSIRTVCLKTYVSKPAGS